MQTPKDEKARRYRPHIRDIFVVSTVQAPGKANEILVRKDGDGSRSHLKDGNINRKLGFSGKDPVWITDYLPRFVREVSCNNP